MSQRPAWIPIESLHVHVEVQTFVVAVDVHPASVLHNALY